MAYKYAQLGLAALLAAPSALALPAPQVVKTVVQTAVVTVAANGDVQAAAAKPAPAPTTAPAQQPASQPKPSSQAAAAPSSAKAAPSAASSGTPTTGGSSSGGKAGLVYSKDPTLGAMATQIAQASNGKITWMYDWEGYSDIGSTGNIEFVPQLHTPDSMFVNAWTSGNPAPQGKGAKHALCVNEPDLNGWSATSIASLWKNSFAPHAQGAKLGSPATTGNTGPQWLSQFLQACDDCQVDFVAYHYYSGSTDLTEMQNAIAAMKKVAGNRPLWITEFGLTAAKDGGNFDAQTRAQFIQKASQWMDGESSIERYSPYMVASGNSPDAIAPGNAIAKAYVAA